MQEKGNAMTAPNTISIDKLVRLVGTPKCPMLIDARPTHDFDADPRLIPSSERCGPDKLTDLPAVGAEHSRNRSLPNRFELESRRGGSAPASAHSRRSAGSRIRGVAAGQSSFGALRQDSTC